MILPRFVRILFHSLIALPLAFGLPASFEPSAGYPVHAAWLLFYSLAGLGNLALLVRAFRSPGRADDDQAKAAD